MTRQFQKKRLDPKRRPRGSYERGLLKKSLLEGRIDEELILERFEGNFDSGARSEREYRLKKKRKEGK